MKKSNNIHQNDNETIEEIIYINNMKNNETTCRTIKQSKR